MKVLEKSILLGSIAVGLLAVFVYTSIAQALVENYYHLKELNSSEQETELWGLLEFVFVLFPGLLVFVGAYIYTVRHNSWGVGMLWASSIGNELVVLWFLPGLAFAFQNRVWIILAIGLEFIIVLLVLLLSFVLVLIQRRQLTNGMQRTRN